MSDNENKGSLINIEGGSLTKPADTLIKKIFHVTGAVCKPWQIRRMAKAEADAEEIKLLAELQRKDIIERAKHAQEREAAIHQMNLDAIAAKALPDLKDDAKPENIDDDWLMNWKEKAKKVSSEEMQNLWARILSGETNNPGTFSKRSLSFLENTDFADADSFQNLCRLVCDLGGQERQPIVFWDTLNSYYSDEVGLSFSILQHLDSIGLIHFEPIATFYTQRSINNLTIRYFNELSVTKLVEGTNGYYKFTLGNTKFTRLGQELSYLCNASEVKGYLGILRDHGLLTLDVSD